MGAGCPVSAILEVSKICLEKALVCRQSWALFGQEVDYRPPKVPFHMKGSEML